MKDMPETESTNASSDPNPAELHAERANSNETGPGRRGRGARIQPQADEEESGYLRPPGPDEKASPVQWLQYLAIRFFLLIVSSLPISFVQFLGARLGDVAHFFYRKHRRICLLNLDQVFGDRFDESEKRQLVRRAFRHFGTAILEFLWFSKIPPEQLFEYVELEGVSNLADPIQAGRSAILCTAHFGNWELMNLVLGQLKLPVCAMARPLDNPLAHELIEKLRTRTGNSVIYKHRAAVRAFSALKRNKIVGVVNDQNVHDKNRIMVPFCGRVAATTPLPALMAIRTGAPIVPGFAIPLGGGRYRLSFQSPILAEPGADPESETLRLTEAINQRLEMLLHEAPAYWLWFHKRFKTGGSGQTDFYERKRTI